MKRLKVLVTAGSTWTPIDDVRVITNIFTGVTGINIAKHYADMGADTTLLYNPKVNEVRGNLNLQPLPFVTFDDLEKLMEDELATGQYDLVIHSAAVSDYGTNVTQLVEVEEDSMAAIGLRVFREVEGIPGKIKSDLPTFTITMGRTKKLVDSIKDWDPSVYLVKFKLEVGRSRDELIEIAKASRLASRADLIVANDLRGARNGIPSALIITKDDIFEIEKRKFLASRLFNTIDWELRKGGRR